MTNHSYSGRGSKKKWPKLRRGSSTGLLLISIALPIFLPLGLDFLTVTVMELCFLILFMVNNGTKKLWQNKTLQLFLGLTFVLSIAALLANYENWFQIIRAGIAPAITAICLVIIDRSDFKLYLPYSDVFKILILSSGALALLPPLEFLPQNISINLLNEFTGEQRRFIIPHTFFLIITPFLLLKGRVALGLSGLSIAFASGSRGAFLGILLTVIYFAATDRSSRNLYKLIVVGVMGSLIALFFSVTIDRLNIQGFVEDHQRINELFSALSTAIKFPNVVFGLPFTFPHWEGYQAESTFDPEKERVFINSAFDVHNGFVFMLLRFGLSGSLLLAILLFRVWSKYPGFRPILLCYLLLWLTSSAPIMVVDGPFALVFAFLLYRSYGDDQRIRTIRGRRAGLTDEIKN